MTLAGTSEQVGQATRSNAPTTEAETLVEGRIFRLGDQVPLDGRLSWRPGAQDGSNRSAAMSFGAMIAPTCWILALRRIATRSSGSFRTWSRKTGP